MFHNSDTAMDPHSSSPPTGTARVLHKFVPHHDQRMLLLQAFDGQIAGIRQMHLDSIKAVLHRARPEATADCLKVDVVPACPGIDAAECAHDVGTVAGRDDPLRDGGRECAVDEVYHALAGLHPAVHGGWRDGV